ncbi:MAG TPA: TolC family protein [Steroidobacteraceae bacterium]|nr:TolC family protein [Steroidobacteraceae bacterium]
MTQGQGRFACRLLLCASALFIGDAYARSLSHDDAVRLAIQRAPMLQSQRSGLEAAQARVESAGRLPDPELILGLDNVPIEGSSAYSLSDDFMTMRRVGVMQTLPNSSKRAADRGLAQAQVDEADAELTQAQLDVARETSIAWSELASAGKLVSALQTLIEQAELQAKVQQSSLAAGQSSTADALNAQSVVVQLKDRLFEAHESEQSARARLEQWIGEDDVSPGESPSMERLPMPRETLLSSLHRHALVRTLDQQIVAARSQADMAKAAKHPDVSVELAYAKRGAAFADMVSLQFRVGLPVFAAHRQDPEIRAANAEVSGLEAKRESELRMHTAETRSQLAAWDAARERLILMEQERLPLAQQATHAAQAAYGAGAGALRELIEARIREADLLAERAQIEARLARAWAFLKYLDSEEEVR